MDRYARLLVEYAAGLRPDQPLFIAASVDYRHLALRIGEAAYQAGAGQVRYRFFDPLEVGQLIRRGRREQITLYHVEIEAWFNEILRTRGALILLHAVDEPELMPELARTHPRNQEFFAHGMSAASLAFQSRTLHQGLCPVVNAPVPSPVWAGRQRPNGCGTGVPF